MLHSGAVDRSNCSLKALIALFAVTLSSISSKLRTIVLFGPSKGLRLHDNPCLRHAHDNNLEVTPVLIRNKGYSKEHMQSIEQSLSNGLAANGGYLIAVDDHSIFLKDVLPLLNNDISPIDSFLHMENTLTWDSSHFDVLNSAAKIHCFSDSLIDASTHKQFIPSTVLPVFKKRYANVRNIVPFPTMTFKPDGIRYSSINPNSLLKQFISSPLYDRSSTGVEFIKSNNEQTALKLVEEYLLLGEIAFSEKYARLYIESLSSSEESCIALRRLSGLSFELFANSSLHSARNHVFFQGEVLSGLLRPLLERGILSPRVLVHARNALFSGRMESIVLERPLACRLVDEAIRHDWHNNVLPTAIIHSKSASPWQFKFSSWKGYQQREGYISSAVDGSANSGSTNCDYLAVLIHGFGGSIDQLATFGQQLSTLTSLLAETGPSLPALDVLAVDLLGFGWSEKPPISYSQYLWRDQVVDMLRRRAQGRKIVLMGNSIGGFTAASVAAAMATENSNNITVAGLVLLNSAGRVLPPNTYTPAIHDTPQFPPYKGPAPEVLRVFGRFVITVLQPRIASLCRWLYPSFPGVVEENELAENIYRDSEDPGAADVIASGGKLPPPLTMNSLLHKYVGPVLVCQGALDPLNDAPTRATQLKSIRDGITVNLLQLGHCPMDENPQQVSLCVKKWLTTI